MLRAELSQREIMAMLGDQVQVSGQPLSIA
jgi:hypothetical protein